LFTRLTFSFLFHFIPLFPLQFLFLISYSFSFQKLDLPSPSLIPSNYVVHPRRVALSTRSSPPCCVAPPCSVASPRRSLFWPCRPSPTCCVAPSMSLVSTLMYRPSLSSRLSPPQPFC
ncbi:hypothetical protein LINPERPRIM_LOCUS20936, partial [Linum perenne]